MLVPRIPDAAFAAKPRLELLEAAGAEYISSGAVSEQTEKALAVLSGTMDPACIERRDHAMLVQEGTAPAAAINRQLVEAGVEVSSIARESGSWEDYFIERMGR